MKKLIKKASKEEKGFSLVEVLVAIAIIGLVAVAFLIALTTAANANRIADTRTTAESLARSQLEEIKQQNYIDYSVTGHAEYLTLAEAGYILPDNFDASFTITILDPDGDGISDDDGLQHILVTVERDSKTIITLEGYKVDR